MIDKLAAQVLSNDDYARQRARWRREIVARKRVRRVGLGAGIEVVFESRITVLFQLQEVLLIESVTRPERVQQVIAEHAERLPVAGTIMASVMLCDGGSDKALQLGAALAQGDLQLQLGQRAARGRLLDEDDVGSPLRYLCFEDWAPRASSGPRALTLEMAGATLTAPLSGTLGRALEREATIPPPVPALLNPLRLPLPHLAAAQAHAH